jgi:cell division protein FtsB
MDTKQNDDSKEDRTEKRWEGRAPAGTTRWLVILGLLFLAAVIFGGGYAYQQSMATSDLTVQNQSLRSTIDQLRNQIDTLTGKLEQMAAPPPAPAPAPVAKAPAAKRANSGSSPVQDRRMKQVQSQLAAQGKELKETQDQLASAKSDLENRLGSTRDELNGSIARTHDELVSLEKRGERSYYEFDLSKSKSYEHEGAHPNFAAQGRLQASELRPDDAGGRSPTIKEKSGPVRTDLAARRESA